MILGVLSLCLAPMEFIVDVFMFRTIVSSVGLCRGLRAWCCRLVFGYAEIVKPKKCHAKISTLTSPQVSFGSSYLTFSTHANHRG